MGNPSNIDRRFDKPAIDALVDLLNASNKSHIRYGEIEADQVTPMLGLESADINTSVRIRLAGAQEGSPSSTVHYWRQALDAFILVPTFLIYVEGQPTSVLFDQLRQFHGVWLTPEDTTLMIGEAGPEGMRVVTFVPQIDHMVWRGSLAVEAGPMGHLRSVIVENEVEGFTREAIVA